MPGNPTYVIGVGEVGVDVITALEERISRAGEDSEYLGLMAVDSDESALSGLSNASTVHLASNTGVVGENIEQYPFLADDITIPDAGSNRLRHVGRYKFDNPVSTFRAHRKTVTRELGQFFDGQRTRLSAESSSRVIVVITSLGDGTGSGCYPLLTAMLNHTIEKLDQDGATTRLVGIGVVPPLDFNPNSRLPPAEPVAYLNTFGALRNLSTLLSADETDRVSIPVYSTVSGEGEGFATPGERFILEDSPFDAFWLINQGLGSRSEGQSRRDTAVQLADAVYAYTATLQTDPLRASTSPVFGTMDYGVVAVPHRKLREFCELKYERQQKRQTLEEFVRPQQKTLREQRQTLRTALQARAENSPFVPDRLDRIYEYLPERPTDPIDFVTKTDQEELEAALHRVADREDLPEYLYAILALRWALEDGPVGPSVRAAVQQVLADVREAYDFDLLAEREAATMSLEEVAGELMAVLEEQRNEYEHVLDETPYSIQDAFPPTHELFTSDRERLERRLQSVERHLEMVSEAQERLDSLARLSDVSARQLKTARERVRRKLDQLERESSHYLTEGERLEGDLAALDRELASLRDALVNPTRQGNFFTIALEWDALDDISLETVEADLTSIQAYLNHGIVTADELEALLERCHKASQDVPETLTHHTSPVDANSIHDETLVMSHEANTPLLEDESWSSFAAPRTVRRITGAELPIAGDPYRIEMVSLASGGMPESLLGFQRLTEMDEEGVLEAMSGTYRDPKRALAYPEWYTSEIRDVFK